MIRKYLTGAVAVTILLTITFLFLTQSLAELRMKRWVKTEATVLKTELVRSYSKSQIGDMKESRYCPVIVCEYMDGEKEYQSMLSDMQEQALTSLNRKEGKKFLSRFKVGGKITIYYKKQTPSICALNIEKTHAPVKAAIAFLLFLTALYIAFSTYNEAHKQIKGKIDRIRRINEKSKKKEQARS